VPTRQDSHDHRESKSARRPCAIDLDFPIKIDDGLVLLRADVSRHIKDGRYPLIRTTAPTPRARVQDGLSQCLAAHGSGKSTPTGPRAGPATSPRSGRVVDPDKWGSAHNACVRVDSLGRGCSAASSITSRAAAREPRTSYDCNRWAGIQPW